MPCADVIRSIWMPPRIPHVVVLGGGISGLTTAYVLRRCARAPLRITVLEQARRTVSEGGVAASLPSAPPPPPPDTLAPSAPRPTLPLFRVAGSIHSSQRKDFSSRLVAVDYARVVGASLACGSLRTSASSGSRYARRLRPRRASSCTRAFCERCRRRSSGPCRPL